MCQYYWHSKNKKSLKKFFLLKFLCANIICTRNPACWDQARRSLLRGPVGECRPSAGCAYIILKKKKNQKKSFEVGTRFLKNLFFCIYNIKKKKIKKKSFEVGTHFLGDFWFKSHTPLLNEIKIWNREIWNLLSFRNLNTKDRKIYYLLMYWLVDQNFVCQYFNVGQQGSNEDPIIMIFRIIIFNKIYKCRG